MTFNGYREFACDLCLGNEAVDVPHCREYTGGQPIHICKRCGFVYVRKRRSAAEIARVWSEELYGEGYASPSAYSARVPAVKARQVYVADFLDAQVGLRGREVCDLGTGEGQFLEIVRRDYGASVFGIEPAQKNCEGLKQLGIKHFRGTIEEFCASPEAKDYQADLVTILWTLENSGLCREILAGAYQILKEDGYVAVATGSRILVPFKKPLHLYLSKNPADTHAYRFSANTLKGILAVSGFEVIHANRYLDSDVLFMIAQKRDKGAGIAWQEDDFLKVVDFFERWHRESLFYHEEATSGEKETHERKGRKNVYHSA